MQKRKIVSFLAILAFLGNYLFPLPIKAAEKSKVAVYDLSGTDVSQGVTTILSEVLRDTIFRTDLFEVLPKEDMDKRLNNIVENQKIKPDCITDICMAEMANVLGVEVIITGSIGKIKDTYVILLRLIDGESAQTINTETITCACREDVLVERVKQGGLRLLQIDKSVRRRQTSSISDESKKEEIMTSAPPPPKKEAALPSKGEEKIAPAKKSYSWVWWTTGTLIIVGGTAAALGGGKKTAASSSSDSGNETTGKIIYTW